MAVGTGGTFCTLVGTTLVVTDGSDFGREAGVLVRLRMSEMACCCSVEVRLYERTPSKLL